jgi:hypothetical protein
VIVLSSGAVQSGLKSPMNTWRLAPVNTLKH